MNTKTATLSELRPQPQAVDNLPAVRVGLTDLQGFELAQRAAKLLATSTLVPKEYQGNLSNCVIALNMAQRIGADPLMVMQNLVIVHGRPTWSAQFLISTVNSCGRFTALRYDFFGEKDADTWGCRAWAVEKATGEKLVGTDVTIAIAKAEGWYGKNGSKWKTIPQQMLMYRAASWWARAYAPELSMGLHTVEEARDVYDATRGEDGNYSVELEELRQDAPQEVVDADTVASVVAENQVAAESTYDPDTGEVIEAAPIPASEPAATRRPPITVLTVYAKMTPRGWQEVQERALAAVNKAPDAQWIADWQEKNASPMAAIERGNPELFDLITGAIDDRLDGFSMGGGE